MENENNQLSNYITEDTYGWTETILTNLSINSHEYDVLRKIANELKLKIFKIEHSADILGVPYFLFVVNPEELNDEDIETLDLWLQFIDNKEMSIIFTHQPNFKLSSNMKRFIKKNTNDFDYDKIKLLILNLKSRQKRHQNKKTSYDRKIFRLFYILQCLSKNNNNITTNDLCREFNVSEKTIHRDIEMLRSIGNDIIYDRNTRTWKMTFCQHTFDLNENI